MKSRFGGKQQNANFFQGGDAQGGGGDVLVFAKDPPPQTHNQRPGFGVTPQ